MSGTLNPIGILCTELEKEGVRVLPAQLTNVLDRIGMHIIAMPDPSRQEPEAVTADGDIRKNADEIVQSEVTSVPSGDEAQISNDITGPKSQIEQPNRKNLQANLPGAKAENLPGTAPAEIKERNARNA